MPKMMEDELEVGTGSEVDLMAELLEMLRRNLGDCDTSIDSEVDEDSDSDSAVVFDDDDFSEEDHSMEEESIEDNCGDLLDDLLEILRRDLGECATSIDSKSDEDSDSDDDDFSDEDQSMEEEFEEANGMDQWTNLGSDDGFYDEPSHTCLAKIHMINEILGRNNSIGLQL